MITVYMYYNTTSVLLLLLYTSILYRLIPIPILGDGDIDANLVRPARLYPCARAPRAWAS